MYEFTSLFKTVKAPGLFFFSQAVNILRGTHEDRYMTALLELMRQARSTTQKGTFVHLLAVQVIYLFSLTETLGLFIFYALNPANWSGNWMKISAKMKTKVPVKHSETQIILMVGGVNNWLSLSICWSEKWFTMFIDYNALNFTYHIERGIIFFKLEWCFFFFSKIFFF